MSRQDANPYLKYDNEANAVVIEFNPFEKA